MKEGDQNGQALAYLNSNRPCVHLGMGTLEHQVIDKMKQILKSLLVIITCLVLIGGFYRFIEQRAPVKVANQFLNAIQNKDWETIVRLSHPLERERLRLNTEQVKIVGENLILPFWQQLGASSGLKRIENPFLPTPEEEKLYFKDTYFFQILRSDKEGALILVTKTKEEWKVNFNLFVFTLLTEAVERGKLSPQHIRPILLRAGIFQIFVGQESIPLPP